MNNNDDMYNPFSLDDEVDLINGLSTSVFGNIEDTEFDTGIIEPIVESQEEKVIENKSKVKKKKPRLNDDLIDMVIVKDGLQGVDKDSLRKMNPSFLRNTKFYLRLRNIIGTFDIRSKVMEHFNIRRSYTGFHDWFKNKRIDLPEVGMDCIATKLNYSLMIVPIKNDTINEKHKQTIEDLQDLFLTEIKSEIELNLLSTVKEKKVKKRNVNKSNEILSHLSNSIIDSSLLLSDNLDIIAGKDDDYIPVSELFVDDDESVLVERTVQLDNNITINEETDFGSMDSEVSFENDDFLTEDELSEADAFNHSIIDDTINQSNKDKN